MVKKSWDQMDNESDEEYKMFEDFLSLGPNRNVYTMVEFLEYRDIKSTLYTTKFKNKWESRAKAFDKYMLELDEKKANEELQFIRMKQKKLARAMSILGQKKIQKILKSEEEIDEMTLKDCISLIDKATRLEMLLTNQPSEIIKNETDLKVEVEHIDPELLKKLGKELTDGNTN